MCSAEMQCPYYYKLFIHNFLSGPLINFRNCFNFMNKSSLIVGQLKQSDSKLDFWSQIYSLIYSLRKKKLKSSSIKCVLWFSSHKTLMTYTFDVSSQITKYVYFLRIKLSKTKHYAETKKICFGNPKLLL